LDHLLYFVESLNYAQSSSEPTSTKKHILHWL